MSGKKETLLEKILKPIRLNPITLGASLTSFGIAALLASSDDITIKLSSVIPSSFGGSSLLIYFKYSIKTYFRDLHSLVKYGFDRRYGELQTETYCDRQAFYVACVKHGYREEVKALINDTPQNQKKWNFLPHV